MSRSSSFRTDTVVLLLVFLFSNCACKMVLADGEPDILVPDSNVTLDGQLGRSVNIKVTFGGDSPFNVYWLVPSYNQPLNNSVGPYTVIQPSQDQSHMTAGLTITQVTKEVLGLIMIIVENNKGLATRKFFMNAFTCPSLPAVSHGTITPVEGSNNRIVVFSCFLGYTLDGDSVAVCSEDGAWNGTSPTCQAVPVLVSQPPEDIEVLTIDGGSSITLNCTFAITPPAQFNWIPPPGTDSSFFQSSVTNLPTDDHVLMSLFIRNADMNMNGNFICEASNFLGSAVGRFALNVVACNATGVPQDGRLIGSNKTTNDIARFVCDEGYYLVGKSALFCEGIGKWSDQLPTCQAPATLIAQDPPIQPPHDFKIGTRIVLTCYFNTTTPVTIEWYTPNSPTPVNNSTDFYQISQTVNETVGLTRGQLIIENAVAVNEGTFICSAFNDVPAIVEDATTGRFTMRLLTPNDHIRLVDPTERKVLQKKLGDPVNMTCVFESNRCFQGIVWWTPKADLPIEQTSGSFEIVTNLCQPKGNSTFSESILTIAEVTANMSGGFTCMAYDNEAPCSHNSTALFELQLPFIPEEVTSKEGQFFEDAGYTGVGITSVVVIVSIGLCVWYQRRKRREANPRDARHP